MKLLDSIESFLSTFQTDLSSVSGQISDLQSRSKDIEGRLKSRKVRISPHFSVCPDEHSFQKIEKPLSNLLTDVTLPPSLLTTILDTDVGENWTTAIVELERHLETLKSRSRVKAVRDLGEVAEGVWIVVRMFQPCWFSGSECRSLGCHKNPGILYGFDTAYTDKYDDKHAGPSNGRLVEVSTTLYIFNSSGTSGSTRNTESIYRCRTGLL